MSKAFKVYKEGLFKKDERFSEEEIHLICGGVISYFYGQGENLRRILKELGGDEEKKEVGELEEKKKITKKKGVIKKGE